MLSSWSPPLAVASLSCLLPLLVFFFRPPLEVQLLISRFLLSWIEFFVFRFPRGLLAFMFLNSNLLNVLLSKSSFICGAMVVQTGFVNGMLFVPRKRLRGPQFKEGNLFKIATTLGLIFPLQMW